MQPSRLRLQASSAVPPDALHFELSFRPPYDWPAMIAFLAALIALCEGKDSREREALAEHEHPGDHHQVVRTVHPQPRGVDCGDLLAPGSRGHRASTGCGVGTGSNAVARALRALSRSR